jgi:outer membrane protein OmpA-like peptidoglycan-associated protein
LIPVEIAAHRRVFNSLHAEIVLLVTYDIRFEPDSATILNDSRKSLDKVYRLIDKSNYDVLIAGHTADIGKASGQYRLSVSRAESIKDYLVEKGIRDDRLTVAGYGGTRPVAPNDTDPGRALNRRVEFLVIE